MIYIRVFTNPGVRLPHSSNISFRRVDVMTQLVLVQHVRWMLEVEISTQLGKHAPHRLYPAVTRFCRIVESSYRLFCQLHMVALRSQKWKRCPLKCIDKKFESFGKTGTYVDEDRDFHARMDRTDLKHS